MLTKFSVKKPFTIFVAVAIVLIFGGVALSRMTPELFPSLNMPYVLVMTADPGASAEEAEKEVTDPVEQQLATLPNIKNITSISGDSYSMVTLEFNDNVNMDAISVDIRDKLEQIKGELPDNAATPVVMKINLDMMPVLVAAVSLEDGTPAQVSSLTRNELLSSLEGTEGVANITTMGLVDDGLQVVLSQDAIDDLNRRVKAQINAEVDKGKNKVKKGINSVKSGKNKVNKGKEKVSDGQENAADKLLEKKKELLKQKAALQAQKDTLIAQKQNLPTLLELAKDLESLYEVGTPEAIAQAEELLKESGYASAEDLNAAIEKLEAIDTTQYDSSIEAIEEGLAAIETQESSLSFSMGKSYSDLSSAQSTLDSTLSQLESTLKEIEDSRDAALAGGDLDNIITMDNVKAILEAQNFAMPAGYVTDGKADILVSVGDKITDSGEMENLILFDLDIDGVDPIRVRDIAAVVPAASKTETSARIDGENGGLLTFSKQSTYPAATVANNILDRFEELEKKHEGLHFTTLMNQGDYIKIVITSVLRNLLLGGILAILILLFFLRDIRPTIITAISIPVSVVFALAMMYFSGVTLNMISLSGLAVGIGMLVDNSIVVIENIYRLRSMGYSLVQSAVSGAVQVAGAITASTLTTICVFAPIVFVDGMTKDIFVDLALTVVYSLMASLFIALTLVPAMAKGMLVKTPKNTVLGQKGRVVRKYREISAWSLYHKKWILIGAVVLLIASAGLLLTKGFEYMPSMSSPQISADITMPEGSTLEETAAANDEMMEAVRKIDGVETVGDMLASGSMVTMSQDSGEQNVTKTSMYIVLDEKKAEQGKVVAKTLKSFEKKYGCTVVTSEDTDMSSMMGGSDVSIKLFSDDLDDLRTSAERVEERMGEMNGLEDISDIEENSTEELHVSVDKNYAMTEGLTVAQIYQQIAAKLKKEETATTIKADDGNIDVTVENSTSDFTRGQLEEMKLTVEKKDGKKEKIRLTDVADIENDFSLKEINHDDKKRCINVTASLKDGYNATKMTSLIRRAINEEHLVSDGVTVEYAGQNEEIMDAMRQLVQMMLIGMLLVYLIMVAQFQSVRSPLIVIFTVPLAYTGGMLALLVCGQVFSVIAMFGMVMLMGIVVNNAIVLVDCINRFRLEGMELDEAIIHGGAVRMRPVIMTAMTTVLGLMPLALGIGNGAEMVQPLAIVCIGGLLYGTATTLLVIPVMYRLIARRRMEKIQDEELEILNV